MKLRNKKTGEIGIAVFKQYPGYEYLSYIALHFGGKYYHFETMDEFAETFEDYTPAEPLIKDEKIRKAVRAWAEVNSVKEAIYAERQNRSLCVLEDMGEEDYSIDLVGWIPTLKEGEVYTIAELCGEEEE